MFVVHLIVFGINFMNNYDHGAIPASTQSLKKDLDLDNEQLGRLGSLVFLGIVAGSMFASMIFNEYSFKRILITSYLGNALGLFVFCQAQNYNL